MNINEAVQNLNLPIQKKIEEQKRIATEILKTLHWEGHTDAIIAGGAPRNWQFGIEARDLDVYFTKTISNSRIDYLFKDKIDIDTGACIQLGKPGYLDEPYYGGNNTIKKVKETCIEGMKVQFITSNPSRVFENIQPSNYKDINFAYVLFKTFDIGICKIGFRKEGNYIFSSDFNVDKENKKLTIKINELKLINDLKNLPKRIEKLKKYFPDHELNII